MINGIGLCRSPLGFCEEIFEVKEQIFVVAVRLITEEERATEVLLFYNDTHPLANCSQLCYLRVKLYRD